MSRAYAALESGVAINIPKGGVIFAAGDTVASPSILACTPTGVGFGPLYIGVPDGGRYCALNQVSFLPDEDEGGDGFLFFGVASGGAGEYVRRNSSGGETAVDPPKDENKTTRRAVLALAGTALAAAVTGSAKGAETDELVALHIAEMDVSELTGPMTIRVLDIVDEVLPPTTEIMVDVDESRVGEITDASKGVTVPSETTGKISVYLRDSRGRLDRLLAWASGIISGDEEITYARELPQPASEYSTDTFLKLSEHPSLVTPVEESGPSGTVLTIGNTTIPHNEEDETSEVGSYGVFDGALVYEVGSNPPASASWALETRLGRLAAISAKYF